MDTILNSFLSLGLIENIDGNDERFSKIEQAATKLAECYREDNALLIPAVLAGLDPLVALDEPAISKAKELLQNEWKAFLTAYTEEPINLYRGIILEACSLVSEDDNNAAIMWLTACDVFPLLRCGKEESTLRQFMHSLGRIAEENSLVSEPELAFNREKVIKLGDLPDSERPDIEVNEEDLYELIAGAAGQQYTNRGGQNVAGQNANRYWAHQNPQAWAGDFADRMSNILTSEIKKVGEQLSAVDNLAALNSLNSSVEKALNEQRLVLQRQQKEFLNYQRQEQTRLNVLWWAEALYSTSQKDSYRVYKPEIAAVLMPYDLLEEILIPSPASVAFTLSEAVSKLPECAYEQDYSFHELLTNIRNERSQLHPDWVQKLSERPSNQHLNIGDIIAIVLTDEHCELDTLIENSIIPEDWKCNLPALSRTLFRQEQAYQLLRGA
ncbi:GTPase-associated system all-helical protein GASH [Shewanella woodyi]|uniref:GTPase-associated system all-helical protein GASH n=1 Tax=Shewanella woodyi TaxID=60961 RepID=UPI0007F97A8B|nr:GTPase-associated system all-helical protein GASH [Shewanella woodyi]